MNTANTQFDLKQLTLKDKVKTLKDTFKARALQTEKDRRVPNDNMQALFDIGYFDAVKPKEYGGTELKFSELVDANIELAASCASTAWISGLLSAHQWLLAMFPKQAQDDVLAVGHLCFEVVVVGVVDQEEGIGEAVL